MVTLYIIVLVLLAIGSGLILWRVWTEDDDEQEAERWSKWN